MTRHLRARNQERSPAASGILIPLRKPLT
jgi:hypothetical protein